MNTQAYSAARRPPLPGAPIIFALHGTGGDEHQFLELAQSAAPHAGVVAPRGPVSEMGAARFFRRTAEGIYDMDDLRIQTSRMAGFVEGIAAENPGSPLYGFGYSNGANILASVVMSHPHLFERVGLLHPLVPWHTDAVPALAHKEVLVTAGRNDPICPWPMTQRLIRWFADQGAKVSEVVHEGAHEVRPVEFSALSRLFSPSRAASGGA